MSDPLGIWQTALRKQLEAYINGDYLRKRARLFSPLGWELAPYKTSSALIDLYKASLTLRSYADQTAVSSYLEHLDKVSCNSESVSEKQFLNLLSSGYKIFHHLIQYRSKDRPSHRLQLGHPNQELAENSFDTTYLQPIRSMARYVRSSMSPYLDAAMIHGSLADDGYSQGFSDLDTLLILKKETVLDPVRLRHFAQLCYQSTAFLYWFDSLQHHGHMAWSQIDFDYYPESWLPLSAISSSKTICVNSAETQIRVRESHQEARRGFEQTVGSLQVMHNKRWKPLTAFDFKYMLSALMLLPARFLQAQGKYCSKKESFALAKKQLSKESWEAINYATQCRSTWPFVPSKLVRGARYLPFGRSEYWIRTSQRRILAEIDSRSLPLFKPELLEKSAELARDMFQIIVPTNDRKSMVHADNEPLSITNEPAVRSLVDYDLARTEYLDQLRKIPGVSAIIEFGTVSIPGLSDLDILVSVDDQTRIPNSGDLSIKSTPFIHRNLIMHDPMVIPNTQLRYLNEFLPVSDLHFLWKAGNFDAALGDMAPEEKKWSEAARLIEKLISYKVWFATVDARRLLDARWGIGVLKSITYSQETMARLGGNKIITDDGYTISVNKVRSSWFKESSIYMRHTALRNLYQMGRELVDTLTRDLGSMLQSEGWTTYTAVKDDENYPYFMTANRICVSFENNDALSHTKQDFERHSKCAGLVVLPNAFLRALGLYCQEDELGSVIKFKPTSIPVLDHVDAQTDFENYLSDRGKRLANQLRFLRDQRMGFGSLLPGNWIDLASYVE